MNNATADMVLHTEGLTKSFFKGGREIKVLTDLALSVKKGEIVGILGASGAGKSTLLHIAGGLDEPTSGKVCHGGEDIFTLSEPDLASFRNRLTASWSVDCSRDRTLTATGRPSRLSSPL